MTRKNIDMLVTLAAIPIVGLGQLAAWGYEFTTYNVMAALSISGIVFSMAHAIHELRRQRNV